MSVSSVVGIDVAKAHVDVFVLGAEFSVVKGKLVAKRKVKQFPLDRWFRQDLESYTDSMLGAGASLRRHVNGDQLDALLTEHAVGARNHGHALWTLLPLELFLRRHGW